MAKNVLTYTAEGVRKYIQPPCKHACVAVLDFKARSGWFFSNLHASFLWNLSSSH